MTELERRVAELEKKFARIEATNISEEKSEHHYIDKKTKQVLKQEIISHKQNYQETFSAKEAREWKTKLESLEKELENL